MYISHKHIVIQALEATVTRITVFLFCFVFLRCLILAFSHTESVSLPNLVLTQGGDYLVSLALVWKSDFNNILQDVMLPKQSLPQAVKLVMIVCLLYDQTLALRGVLK